MKKIIFCDIDGTLIDGFNGIFDISKVNIEAIKKAKEKAYFVLTSGRAKFMLDGSFDAIKPDGYILSNGAYIEFKNEIIKSTTYTKSQIEKVREFNKSSKNYHLLVNQKGFLNEFKTEPRVLDLLKNLGFYEEFSLDSLDEKYHFMIELCNSEADVEPFLAHFKNDFKIKRQYKDIAFDINQLNDDKGEAVKYLLKHLNCDGIETYCIGDSENDLEMMSLVDHPIAMGNAKRIIKEKAQHITDTIAQDGVAKALKYYNLI